MAQNMLVAVIRIQVQPVQRFDDGRRTLGEISFDQNNVCIRMLRNPELYFLARMRSAKYCYLCMNHPNQNNFPQVSSDRPNIISTALGSQAESLRNAPGTHQSQRQFRPFLPNL